jgi:transglutaminase-like putative cysteine protease
VVILVVWAAALAWLVRRVSFRSTGARLAEAALTVSPGALFYRVSLGAQQLGYASSTVDTLADSLRLVDVFVLDAPALGRLNRIEGRSVATLDRSLHLGELVSEVDGETLRFDTHARVGPDRRFHVTIASTDDSLVATLPPEDTVVLPTLWPLRLAFGGGLDVGRTRQARVFDPFSAALNTLALSVGAESTFVLADSADFDSTTMAWVPVRFDTVRAFRVDAAGDGGSGTLATWIDAQGRIVRATTRRGYTMERTAFELAYENFRHRDTLRLMRATAAPGPGTVVAATLLAAGVRPEPASLTAFRVRLGEGGLEGLDLAGGRQRLAGDTLIVHREGATALQARYRLPNADPALRSDLLPDLLITSGDLRVAAQARLLAGRDRDPGRVASRLVHWVAGNVRPEPRTGITDAARVLESRRGDANEHAVLLVALARALGLPARPVSGLVRASGRYYYHAWAEVYLGDWVAVDPLFDQFPTDAAHLRLAIGGLVRPTDLARLVGRLTLDPS